MPGSEDGRSPLDRLLRRWPLARRLERPLASAAFLIVLLVALVGTRVPFTARQHFLVDVVGSNPINRVVMFSALALVLVPALLAGRRLLRLARAEKFLTAIIAWSALTVLWSEDPLATVKRVTQLGIVALVVATYVSSPGGAERAGRWLRSLLVIVLGLSLLTVLFVPAAMDPAFLLGRDYWRGITHQKNDLGQLALVATIFFAYTAGRVRIRSTTGPGSGAARLAMAVAPLSLAGVLLAGSGSISPLFVGIVTAVLALLYAGLLRRGRDRWFPVLLPAALLGGAATSLLLGATIVGSVLALFGRDLTLTTRVGLWQQMVARIAEHPIVGSGFGATWTPWNEWVVAQYAGDWYPSGAHQGYLDIVNETGLVGLLLVIALLVSYLRKAVRERRVDAWFWLIVATTLLNLVEITLLRLRELTSILLVIGYLQAFVAADPATLPPRAASAPPPSPATD